MPDNNPASTPQDIAQKSGGSNTWASGIAVLSSAVTVVLTVLNSYTKDQIDKASQGIQSRLASVEESKERVQRYQFVYQTLSGAARKDSSDQAIALGIARLALDSSEGNNLFAALAIAGIDSGLRRVARRAAVQAQAEASRDIQSAMRFERSGYAFLIKAQPDSAAAAFGAAERAYPTYHQAYELQRYLKSDDRGKTKSAIAADVLNRYSIFATADERRQLQQLIVDSTSSR
jgi:hypothetical protein